MSRHLTVMLVAAEASGDARGAELARALKKKLGGKVRFIGVGGARMADEGVQSPFDIAELSILGLWEGLRAYGKVKKRVEETAAMARADRPDVAVLIDSWGFTVRVAKALRAVDPGILLVKYVGPQVWASRPGRAKVLAGAVDHLLAIHAFDAPYFEKEGLATTFVGNGALAKDFSHADPRRLREAIGAHPDEPILLVLPGSRPSEIERMMPAFEDAVSRLKTTHPGLHVVIPAASTVTEAVKARAAGWPYRVHVIEDERLKDDAMVAGTVALACSGTVTIELALAGVPMVVGYRVGNITHAILKHLILTPWITLFNIAARDFVAPELIQSECTGPKLAAEIEKRVADPGLRRRQVEKQFQALDLMGRGGPDPADAAAKAILRLMAERN
ncbi:lipid-A-disaccharide synthase [Caulobacter sp. NIBR2454]|uniref:lipid-A-disaccharide synthase n=1 Tax=Caulobacter sp. NIBR2454 TaxID=3015996 RepID=UPI0022B6D8DC|nr:lipid-A-disaccharide synthase [Caulobacter sp. NIBR2454]